MKTANKPEIVVVTGASAGLGRAIVRAFAREGAHLGLIARGYDGLTGARSEVESMGSQAVICSADVADPEQLEAATDTIEKQLGPIDIWVNNAMASVFSPIKAMTAAEFKRVTEVTYLGYIYGTLAALKRMLPRDHGTIVQVGSALAYRGIPLQAAYCGAKHAVQGFMDSLRCELLHDQSKVRVTMVHMPALNTPQFRWVKSHLPRKAQPVPPIFQPEVGAAAVVWAARHPRRELYVGWPTVKAIVGNKLVPWLGDRYLARTGYQSQQTNAREDPERPHNLWEAVPGDHGAHGVFDRRASDWSAHLWATTHRGWLTLAGLGLAGLTYMALTRETEHAEGAEKVQKYSSFPRPRLPR